MPVPCPRPGRWQATSYRRGRLAPGDFGADFEQVADPTAPGSGSTARSSSTWGSSATPAARARPFLPQRKRRLHCGPLRQQRRPARALVQGPLGFIPAYRFGQRPFGVFPGPLARHDPAVAGAAAARTSTSAPPWSAATSAAKRWVKLSAARVSPGTCKPRQTFAVHGYPAEEPFDGETQRICPSTPFIGHDPYSFDFPGPLNLAVTATSPAAPPAAAGRSTAGS